MSSVIKEEHLRLVGVKICGRGLKNLKVGDRVEVLSGGEGAYGVNGMKGKLVTWSEFTNGCRSGAKIYVRVSNSEVWGLAVGCKLKLIK